MAGGLCLATAMVTDVILIWPQPWSASRPAAPERVAHGGGTTTCSAGGAHGQEDEDRI